MCKTKVKSLSFHWDILLIFQSSLQGWFNARWEKLKAFINNSEDEFVHYISIYLQETKFVKNAEGAEKLYKALPWPCPPEQWHPIWDLSNWAEWSLGSTGLKETNAQKREYQEARQLGIISKSKSGAIGKGKQQNTHQKKQNLGAEMLWSATISKEGTGWAGLNTGKIDLSMTCYTIFLEYSLCL